MLRLARTKAAEDQKPAAPTGEVSIEHGNGTPAPIETSKPSSTGNVLSLRSRTGKAASGKSKKVIGAELRAQQDVAELPGQHQGFTVMFPDPNNIMFFYVTLSPKDGLYKGAEFKFAITIPTNYPYEPPKVVNNTLTFHPNLDMDGHVCLNILREDWRPVLNLACVLFGLMTLFLEPNPDDPLNKEAARQMIENRSEFERNVKTALRGGYVSGRQFPKLL